MNNESTSSQEETSYERLSFRDKLSYWMREYEKLNSELAACRQSLNELIPIAERMLRIKQAKFMLDPNDDDAFEKSEEYKSAIERAKLLK